MTYLIQKNKNIYEPLRAVNVGLISSIRATNSGTFVYCLSDGTDLELQLSIREYLSCFTDRKKVVVKGSYEYCVISTF